MKEDLPWFGVIANINSPFRQLRDEMDRLLTGYLGPGIEGILPQMFREQPAVNVWQRDDALVVEMEAPAPRAIRSRSPWPAASCRSG